MSRAEPDALTLAQRGDDGAFEELYRAHQPYLLGYLRAMLGDQAKQRADDVAADVWVAFVQTLPTLDPDTFAVRAWLVTVARHRVIDGFRARQRRPEVLVDEIPDLGTAPDIADDVVAQMSFEDAISLVDQLPPAHAEVIHLRVVAGLDVADVAEITGLTSNNVRVQTHRALARLRRLAQPGEGNSELGSASM